MRKPNGYYTDVTKHGTLIREIDLDLVPREEHPCALCGAPASWETLHDGRFRSTYYCAECAPLWVTSQTEEEDMTLLKEIQEKIATEIAKIDEKQAQLTKMIRDLSSNYRRRGREKKW